MRLTVCVLMLTAAILSSNAQAGSESDKLMAKFEKCGQLSSYRFLAGCYIELYREADNQLNKEYKKLTDYLEGSSPNRVGKLA
ncbi:MAG: hypothetical protein Kow0096_24040 [Thiohalomonadaceae bacterium]